MSAGERKTRTRWPGIRWVRRWHNHQHRVAVRRLLRQGDYDAVPRPRASSAKWMVW